MFRRDSQNSLSKRQKTRFIHVKYVRIHSNGLLKLRNLVFRLSLLIEN